MARQAIKSYAIDPAHTNDSHAIDRARSNRLRIVSVCGGYKKSDASNKQARNFHSIPPAIHLWSIVN